MFEKKYKAENSRRFKRFRANYLVKYQLAGALEEPFVSNLKDLSAGGCRFWSEVAFPEGKLLKISIWIPPIEKTLEALARLVRVRRAPDSDVYYLSVSFAEGSPEIQTSLNDFIEKLAEDRGARRLIDDAPIVSRSLMPGLMR